MIDTIRNLIRNSIRSILKVIVLQWGIEISPDLVTIVGTVLFLPIAYYIAIGHTILPSLLLIVIGLLDTVDGELARLQKKESNKGVLLDASSDRIKEAILYVGITIIFFYQNTLLGVVAATVAVTGAMSVSYIKAKGEMVLATTKHSLTATQINRIFQDGIMRFEIRITLIILGLLVNALIIAVCINAILSWYTALYRLIVIHKKL